MWSGSFANVNGWIFPPMRPHTQNPWILLPHFWLSSLRPVDQHHEPYHWGWLWKEHEKKEKKKNTWPKAFSIYYIGKFNLIYWKNILLAGVIMIWIQKANINTQPTSPGLNENSSNIWSRIKRAQRALVIYIWVKVTLCLSEVHFCKGQDGERKLGAENFTKAAPDLTVGWPTDGEAAVTSQTPGSDDVSKQKYSLQWSQRGAWSQLLEASRQRPGP